MTKYQNHYNTQIRHYKHHNIEKSNDELGIAQFADIIDNGKPYEIDKFIFYALMVMIFAIMIMFK